MRNSVNLLPPPALVRLRQRQCTLIWARLLMYVGSACCIVVLIGQVIAVRQASSIQSLMAESAKPRQLMQENANLRREVVRLQTSVENRGRLKSAYSPLVMLAMLTELKSHVGGKLDVERLEFEDLSLANRKPSSGTTPLGESTSDWLGTVRLRVTTDSVANSARIVDFLRSTGKFHGVQMDGAIEKINASAESDLRFSVVCKF